jgi:predicted transcriptional regulator of viral defense system
MKNPILELHQKNKTVFTTDDLRIIWKQANSEQLKSKVQYYVSKGDLIRLTKGIYALDDDYNQMELATSMYTPAYVSFETVLREHGLIFQHYESIFVASYLSREVTVQSTTMVYRKLKQEVLVNPEGILHEAGYAKATKERAVLDTLYLKPNFYFDNLHGLDWTLCRSMATLYQNQALIDRLKSLEQNAE